MKRQELNSGDDLYAIAEEMYFWLMRSISEPKNYSETFQSLSQLMRISKLSKEGGDYLPRDTEIDACIDLRNIKESVQDGTIHLQNLLSETQRVLRKVTHENPRAQVIAHATEIEYIFCIHSTYNSSAEAAYRQKFKGYLKTLVDTANNSLSLTQAKAIVQVLSQVIKNPHLFSSDPQASLCESLKKSGIIVVERPNTPESETA